MQEFTGVKQELQGRYYSENQHNGGQDRLFQDRIFTCGPNAVPFDVRKRVQQLHSYLDPNHPDYEPEYQHGNIKTAIKLYEEGKIDGMQRVYVKDGKIVSTAEAFKGPSPSMGEGLCHD